MKTLLLFATPLGLDDVATCAPGLLDLRFAQFFAPWALLRNPFGIADLGIDDLVFPDVVADEDFTFIRNPLGVGRRCDVRPRVARPALRAVLRTLGFAPQSLWDCRPRNRRPGFPGCSRG